MLALGRSIVLLLLVLAPDSVALCISPCLSDGVRFTDDLQKQCVAYKVAEGDPPLVRAAGRGDCSKERMQCECVCLIYPRDRALTAQPPKCS